MPLSSEVRTPLWATARDAVAVIALVFSLSLCDAAPDFTLLVLFADFGPDFATSPLCMPDADAASFPFPQPDTAKTRMPAAASTRNDVLIVPPLLQPDHRMMNPHAREAGRPKDSL